ncbi:hypothetical protein BST61_g3559 [Cercospora zeina]
MDLAEAVCIKGYKDNPDRKIGLVARLRQPMSIHPLSQQLQSEFHGAGELYQPEKRCLSALDTGVFAPVRIVAIMNAFHADEIQRVLEAAREKTWIEPEADGSTILYLTGAARDYGLAAIKEVNMLAFCVGHRACEEWGIRFLAAQLRNQWPDLDVLEVLEEEEPRASRTETVEKLVSDVPIYGSAATS